MKISRKNLKYLQYTEVDLPVFSYQWRIFIQDKCKTKNLQYIELEEFLRLFVADRAI